MYSTWSQHYLNVKLYFTNHILTGTRHLSHLPKCFLLILTKPQQKYVHRINLAWLSDLIYVTRMNEFRPYCHSRHITYLNQWEKSHIVSVWWIQFLSGELPLPHTEVKQQVEARIYAWSTVQLRVTCPLISLSSQQNTGCHGRSGPSPDQPNPKSIDHRETLWLYSTLVMTM